MRKLHSMIDPKEIEERSLIFDSRTSQVGFVSNSEFDDILVISMIKNLNFPTSDSDLYEVEDVEYNSIHFYDLIVFDSWGELFEHHPELFI